MSIDDFMALDPEARAIRLDRLLVRWAKLIERTTTWAITDETDHKAISVWYNNTRRSKAFGSSRIDTFVRKGRNPYNCLPLKIADLNLLSDGQLARFIPTLKDDERHFGEYILTSSLTGKEQLAIYKRVPPQFR